AEHLRERHARLDRGRVPHRLHLLDAAAAAVEVAHDVTEELLRGHDLDRHGRLEQLRLRALHRLLERHRAGDLEGTLRGVDLVVRAVDELDPDVDHGIAGENSTAHSLLNALVDGRDVLTRDLATHDLVHELVARARLERLDVDDHVSVLARAARLPHEAALDLLHGPADRLAI